MDSVKGLVVSAAGDFSRRMTEFRDVFTKNVGEELHPGTLNVKIDRKIEIKEDFRILGAEINEPEQDLLFEHYLINGTKGYRIRPHHFGTGGGGHGDDTLEISAPEWIPNAETGSEVEVIFFRALT